MIADKALVDGIDCPANFAHQFVPQIGRGGSTKGDSPKERYGAWSV